jgi:putative cell wall-binding protein
LRDGGTFSSRREGKDLSMSVVTEDGDNKMNTSKKVIEQVTRDGVKVKLIVVTSNLLNKGR